MSAAAEFLTHWGDRRDEVTEPILNSWFENETRRARLDQLFECRLKLRFAAHEHVWIWEPKNPNGPCATAGCGCGERHEVCDLCGLPKSLYILAA